MLWSWKAAVNSAELVPADMADVNDAALLADKRILLERVRRLVAIQNGEVWSHLSDDGRSLVQHALYSVYCDCLDAGIKAEAQQLLTGATPA